MSWIFFEFFGILWIFFFFSGAGGWRSAPKRPRLPGRKGDTEKEGGKRPQRSAAPSTGCWQNSSKIPANFDKNWKPFLFLFLCFLFGRAFSVFSERFFNRLRPKNVLKFLWMFIKIWAKFNEKYSKITFLRQIFFLFKNCWEAAFVGLFSPERSVLPVANGGSESI